MNLSSLAKSFEGIAKRVSALRNESLIAFTGLALVFALPVNPAWMLFGAAAPVCVFRLIAYLSNRKSIQAAKARSEVLKLAADEKALEKTGVPPASRDILRENLYKATYGVGREEHIKELLG